MYMKTPLTGSERTSPVLTFSTSRASTISDPSIFLGMESQTNSNLGLAKARSCAMGAARSSSRREFVIATETGILHRLRREVPDADKRFHAVSERAICRYMKMITLSKVLRALRDDVHQVTVPEPVAARARRALERMVSLG